MTAMDEQEQRRRRLAAWRGSRLVLARRSTDRTVGDGLAALAAGAGSVHDPDDAVDVYGGGVVTALERRVAGLL
ncbi:threonine aldolase, partial [Streptomyces sp. MBT57]|nr:threonine aldolase [Streptomyces sp. MBT57]